ncbi:hypothetical protein ZHAS_00006522 [Anopheles sinensis]|uniref:Uncharacterized protein n=1 Tax=Anopheles sinensis TaxID=74873 RepID=A0A084VMJ0_ANOSI|nr:hypothetical protein ZHAS_00006522 [Anopheles sinensis]
MESVQPEHNPFDVGSRSVLKSSIRPPTPTTTTTTTTAPKTANRVPATQRPTASYRIVYPASCDASTSGEWTHMQTDHIRQRFPEGAQTWREMHHRYHKAIKDALVSDGKGGLIFVRH